MTKTETHKQPLWMKTIFSLLILIIFIGVGEVALRLVDPDLYQKNQFFPINRDIDFPEVYNKDTDLFWKFRPNQTIDSRSFSDIVYRINNYGMRGDDVTVEKNSYRIIAIGNSCTFGWGVTSDLIWTSRLEQALNEKLDNKTVEVLNCGVPGYSSHQGKIYLKEKLLKFKPDMVLIMFGWNDQWPAGQNITDNEQQLPGGLIVWTQNILSKLKLYQLSRKIILSSSEAPTKISLIDTKFRPRVDIIQFPQNLEEIINTARQNNIKPVLLVPPVSSLERYITGTNSVFLIRHSNYQEKIIKLGIAQEVMVLNPQLEFSQRDNLFDDPLDDPIHFNGEGHKVFTDVITDSVLFLITL